MPKPTISRLIELERVANLKSFEQEKRNVYVKRCVKLHICPDCGGNTYISQSDTCEEVLCKSDECKTTWGWGIFKFSTAKSVNCDWY